MRTILLFTALLLFAVASNAQDKSFRLKGFLEGLEDGPIYLAYGTMEKMKADTVQVRNGRFVFSASIKEPAYAMLFNQNYTVKLDMLVDAGEMTLKGNAHNLADVLITGTEDVQKFAAYQRSLLKSREPVQQLYEKWLEADAKGDTVAVTKYKTATNDAMAGQIAIAKRSQGAFITENPNNNGSAWELLHYVNAKNLGEGTVLYENLSSTVRTSEMGRELAQRISALQRTKVGAIAPQFSQQNVEGKEVHLADYKGKYVLVEFWASWCFPCRAENPNLLAAFNHYKTEGLQVLAVSLDDNDAKWKEAIVKDGLPWIHVSDLGGWKNQVAVLYAVNAVPANFLLDPSGKIIAKDLRGENLIEQLAVYLK